MRAPLVIALGLAAAGCKTDRDEPRPANTATPSRPAPTPRRPSPPPSTTPAEPPPAEDQGFDRERLEEIAPELPGATALSPLVLVEERERAHQTFCVPGTDAAAAAQSIAAALERSGWTDVASRGTADRAAASATQGNIQISITVGGRDAACAGQVATARYTSDTIVIPPLDEGERIR